MPEVVVSDEFLEQFEALTLEKQKQTLKAIRLLSDNPRHPSLKAHQLDGLRGNLWDCYVSVGANAHRIIYEPEGSLIKLWKVGDHSVIDRAASLSFAANTQFRRMGEPEPEKPEPQPFEIPAEWLTPRVDREPNNPFAYLPAAHLRILGVPAALVKAVKTVPYLEDVERIPGLPEHSVTWLLELATNARLERIAFDEGRLIFRATLDQLEGYVEGRIKRLMLNLTPEQTRQVNIETTAPTLLRGCAGSGKTTVGVYRAIKCAEMGVPVILLTFNKTLAHAARDLIEELIGPLPGNLQVFHLDSWSAQFLRLRGRTVDVLSDDERSKLLQKAIDRCRTDQPNTIFQQPWNFFRDEIAHVIKGNGLRDESEYLTIPRFGRKSALGQSARRAVWAVYLTYQESLHGRMDWQDLARAAYDELLRSPLEVPYDHTIVDEVQDLSAVQLRLIQRLSKGGDTNRPRSSLFVGDIAQSIYTRGYPWERAGLQFRGA